MKKILAMIMASCLCLGILAGCGGTANSNSSPEENKVSSVNEEEGADVKTSDSRAEIC